MRIERFFLGMIDDKATLLKTSGVSRMLHDKTFQRLRKLTVADLTVADSGKYLWLPTEQVVAAPNVVVVCDKHGREYTTINVRLVTIHDYLTFTEAGKLLQELCPDFDEKSEVFEPLEVNP